MTSSLSRALDFLVAGQTPAGRIPIGMGLELGGADDDPSLFATAMVAETLWACDDARARELVARCAEHLAAYLERPGVWRHWTAEHPQFHALPADADDTAWSSTVLQLAGLAAGSNRALLLENRDAAGRFHTWLLVRRGRRPSRALLRIGLRRLRRPVHAVLFWRATSAEPADVDGVVHANVLAYLGPGPHAAAAVRWIDELLAAGAEDRCDKWYRSGFLLYSAIARGVAAGIPELAAAGALTRARIEASVAADGRLGSGPLDTALAVRALLDLGAGDSSVLPGAVAYLEGAQEADGGWPTEPVYYGGPRHHPEVPCWGSRALTTGLVAGALSRTI